MFDTAQLKGTGSWSELTIIVGAEQLPVLICVSIHGQDLLAFPACGARPVSFPNDCPINMLTH
jgi:hypothetical protein